MLSNLDENQSFTPMKLIAASTNWIQFATKSDFSRMPWWPGTDWPNVYILIVEGYYMITVLYYISVKNTAFYESDKINGNCSFGQQLKENWENNWLVKLDPHGQTANRLDCDSKINGGRKSSKRRRWRRWHRRRKLTTPSQRRVNIVSDRRRSARCLERRREATLPSVWTFAVGKLFRIEINSCRNVECRAMR